MSTDCPNRELESEHALLCNSDQRHRLVDAWDQRPGQDGAAFVQNQAELGHSLATYGRQDGPCTTASRLFVVSECQIDRSSWLEVLVEQ